MNERLKELMLKAGYAAPGIAGRAHVLADLIVRECVEQVWYTREDGINGNVSEIIKERMKRRFGVE